MRTHIAMLCLFAAACTTSDEPETVYDPCSPLTITIAAEVGAAEAQGVEDAVAAWGSVLPTQIEIARGTPGPGQLPIEFVTDAFYRAIYWDSTGVISINPARLAAEHYGVAIAHELGHAFGLIHVAPDERASVMNVGNVELAPTELDAREVTARWETCADLP